MIDALMTHDQQMTFAFGYLGLAIVALSVILNKVAAKYDAQDQREDAAMDQAPKGWAFAET
jgi:hypothetical protein